MSESQQPTHLSKLLTERMQSYVMKAWQTIQLSYQHTIRNWLNRHTVQSFVSLFLIGAFLSIAVASCSGSSSASKNDVKLRLVSFSVTKAAHDQIIPIFVEKWKQEHNQNVTFEQSYGGSGAQAAAVIAGSQEADIVHLALPLDVSKIALAGLIKSGWETKAPRNGIVGRLLRSLPAKAIPKASILGQT